MIEVLIEGMTSNKGGKETYIVNMFDALDKTKYRFTFVAYDDEIAYESYLVKQGAKVVHVTARSKGVFRHKRELNKLFTEQSFDVVWAHKTTLSACEILEIAKKRAVPVRIIHSHSSANMGGRFTYMMHTINKRRIFKLANAYLACSETASKWFFGDREVDIARNGINLDKFKYSEEVRNNLRQKLHLEDAFVIGHVGRFGIEKNHKKLINVFSEYIKKNPNAKLLLCGDGEERANIEAQIDELGLKNDVILAGVVSNVHEYLQVMDVIVMPSLFEGLPFSLLEAQAAGLKCVVSDTVSDESNVLGRNKFIPLDATDLLWATSILAQDFDYDRSDSYHQMAEAGYDVAKSAADIDEKINLWLSQSK